MTQPASCTWHVVMQACRMSKLLPSTKNGGVEEYHKSVKSNTALAKSPNKIIKTQTNQIVLSIVAYVKLEWLKQRTGNNHFAMKAKIYLAAQQAAYNQRKKLYTPRAA